MTTDDNASGPSKGGRKVFSRVLLVCLLLGVALHLAGFIIFRVVYRDLPSREDRRPFVRFETLGPAEEGTGLAEQAALLDSAPLFIPTRWNAAQSARGPSMETRVKVFDPFAPAINLLADLGPGQFMVSGTTGVNGPEDLLASRFWRFFSDFAERPPLTEPFASTGIVAEVVPFDSEAAAPLRLPVDLGRELVVPVARPVEYHFRPDYGAPGSEPFLARSSGNDEFDAATREWLTRPDVVARLPQGYSSITVYP